MIWKGIEVNELAYVRLKLEPKLGDNPLEFIISLFLTPPTFEILLTFL